MSLQVNVVISDSQQYLCRGSKTTLDTGNLKDKEELWSEGIVGHPSCGNGLWRLPTRPRGKKAKSAWDAHFEKLRITKEEREESNELFIFGSVIKEIKNSVATHFIHKRSAQIVRGPTDGLA